MSVNPRVSEITILGIQDKAGNNQNNSAVYNTLNNQMSESLFWTITYDNMGNIKTKYNKITKEKRRTRGLVNVIG